MTVYSRDQWNTNFSAGQQYQTSEQGDSEQDETQMEAYNSPNHRLTKNDSSRGENGGNWWYPQLLDRSRQLHLQLIKSTKRTRNGGLATVQGM